MASQPQDLPKSSGIPTSKLLTLKQAAAFLNVSTKTVRRMIDRGLIPVQKVLRIWLIPVDVLERVLQSMEAKN